MKKGGNIFVVKEIDRPKIETITKIFYLKYATTTNSRLTKQISEGFSAEGSSDSDDAEGSSGIKEAVEEVLTENGRVVENSRTNSLLVTDIASQFPLIESTISKLDISIPQVLIEVEMLDVSKNLIDKIGFKIGEQPISYSGPTHTSYWPFENSEAVAKSGTPTTYTVGTLDLSRFTGLINILKSDAKTRYLARPRLLTLSNETAEIKITTDEAIGLKTTTQASEGTASQTSEAERATTGVSLKVTPQVNYVTGEITMFIEPTVSEARQGGTFGGTTFKDPEERGTKSVVRIKNSQTVVIGGLLRKQLNQTVTKVPFLGDVPIMGVLFRHNDKSQDEDRELIIFITPRIINERSIAANNNNTMISTYNLEREQDKPVKRYREINSELDKIDLIKNFRR